MKTIEDEADYYIQDADARMRSYKPEDLPTFTEQLRGAFIAGANKVRERLIAHYEVEIKAYQKAVKEGLEREKIAKDVIAEKRKEIARLTKWNEVETDKDGLATFKALDAIFDRLPCLIKDNQSGEIELIDYDNAPEWRGDIERKPSCYRWREIPE